MTDEEQPDRRRALIIAAIIFLIVSILAGFMWFIYMTERWKNGGPPIQVG
jgi:flagellar basal body-associated protein FliL